jgi:hypothetical protein
MILSNVVKIYGPVLHIRFDLTKYTCYAEEIGNETIPPLTLDGIDRNQIIRGLKNKIKASIEDEVLGKF